ncbi:WhiB family transcriptional regulator [Streptomyces sp. NPDC006290]|uniref:WhiB family transcriptional regulator n=1 Tax=Streptomyces sp. NPDC006290 TaxID=3156745 RepID=UPI0033B7970B
MSEHHAVGARPVVSLGVPGFAVEAQDPLPCRVDPEAYFADGVRPLAARALCAGCGYLEACRAYALENPGLWGVWGGTTRRERQAVRRRGAVGDRGPPYCSRSRTRGAQTVRTPGGEQEIRAAVCPPGYR